MQEHRRFRRIQAPLGVVYYPLKKTKRKQFNLTLAKDLSGGGIRIQAKTDLRVKDKLGLEIHIPHVDEPIKVAGEVTWFGLSKKKSREVREAGIRFRDVSPKAQDQILQYVHAVGLG